MPSLCYRTLMLSKLSDIDNLISTWIKYPQFRKQLEPAILWLRGLRLDEVVLQMKSCVENQILTKVVFKRKVVSNIKSCGWKKLYSKWKVVSNAKSCIEWPKFYIKWKFGFLAGLGHHRTLFLFETEYEAFFGVINNYAFNRMIKPTASFHNARFEKTFLSSAESKFHVNCRQKVF